jgi:hypothetical protein
MRRSLFRLYQEGEALAANDADGLAGLGARLAPRPPELTLDANLPSGSAGGRHHGVRSDQRFRAGLDAPPSREADPEIGLRDLDDGARSHEHEPPRRGEDEERQEDRSDEEQRLRRRFGHLRLPPAGGQGQEGHQDAVPLIPRPSRQLKSFCAPARP